MRVALLSYRSKPHCGGQGIYIRHLSRELVALGHSVEVFSGQPYPELDEGVGLTKVPSLDLYREPDPFRVPKPSEFRDLIDVEEFLTMCTAGFPEPRTFGKRVARLLRGRQHDFDIVPAPEIGERAIGRQRNVEILGAQLLATTAVLPGQLDGGLAGENGLLQCLTIVGIGQRDVAGRHQPE